jgi:rRNA processing protein Gar1
MTEKKIIGKIMHKSSSSKNLIIELDGRASIGDYVYSKNMEKIGEVFDIMGPINSPIASIKLEDEDSSVYPGTEIFTRERQKRKGSRKRRKRR